MIGGLIQGLKRVYMRHGIAFLRPGMLNSRHGRANVRLGRVNLRPKRAYLRLGLAEFQPEKVKFEAQGGQSMA